MLWWVKTFSFNTLFSVAVEYGAAKASRFASRYLLGVDAHGVAGCKHRGQNVILVFHFAAP